MTTTSTGLQYEDTLLGSVWRTLCAPSLEAVVHYGLPETPQGRDRRALARDLQNTIEQLRQV